MELSPKAAPLYNICHTDENNIGNKGCKIISRITFGKIKIIALHKNCFGKEGLMHLSKAKWRAYQNIYVGENRIGVDSTKWLVKSVWWERNQIISLSKTIFTKDNCEITFE